MTRDGSRDFILWIAADVRRLAIDAKFAVLSTMQQPSLNKAA